MNTSYSTRRNTWLSLLIGSGLLIAGLYALYLVYSPAIHFAATDITDNATTKYLETTKPHPAKPKLLIPKIDVQVPYGKDESSLLKGAWWRAPENGNPRDGGNFVLAAHRFIMDYTPAGVAEKSPFYNIDKLEVGDTIYVDYENERYAYTVSELKSVEPTATHIEHRTDDPQLTLYSCTLGGSLDGRVVVIATPV